MRARHTVLAAGVWTGALTSAVELRPSRGSHLLVPASRLGEPRAAVNVPVPGEHGRWVFALPRSDGLVAIGLTDVPAPGEPADDPRPDAAEEAELLDRASAALDAPLGAGDVCGRYAGLRPLAAGDGDTADLSRRHLIVDDPSGALAIVGGKLTTYRRMAQDVVDRLTDRPCRTHRLPLVGAAAARGPAVRRGARAARAPLRHRGARRRRARRRPARAARARRAGGAGVRGRAAVGGAARAGLDGGATSSTGGCGPGSCRRGGPRWSRQSRRLGSRRRAGTNFGHVGRRVRSLARVE